MVDEGKETQTALADFIVQRTADMIGRFEWLHTELQKTAATQRLERAEHLSNRLDELCARLDRVEQALRSPQTAAPSRPAHGFAEPLDQELRTRLAAAEEAILEATGEGAVFTLERAQLLAERLEALESALDEGERKLGVTPAP